MISRRRFLSVSAAYMGASMLPALAAVSWHGRAFGADVSITLRGGAKTGHSALQAARDTLSRLERMFSIYDPASDLSELNRSGFLSMQPEFRRLIEEVNKVHIGTDRLFDPTIQPIFAAMAQSGGQLDSTKRRSLQKRIGWQKIKRTDFEISFTKPDMAMTLNGIAQGFATDRVTEVLAGYGFTDAVVNIGEYRAGSEPVRLRIENSSKQPLAVLQIRNNAMATSSANGFTFANGAGHILSPVENADSSWDTVSVIAPTATLADGYSTALLLSPDLKLAKARVADGTLMRVLLFDKSGKLQKI